MKYNRAITNSHPVSMHIACIDNINVVIQREGYDGEVKFEDTDVCLDFDLAECKLAETLCRNRNRSMDMGFCVVAEENAFMVLAELRFNYINPANLNNDNLSEKIAGTRSLIQHFCTATICHPLHFFIFKSEYIEEARSRITRMIPIFPHPFEVLDIDQLKNKFFV